MSNEELRTKDERDIAFEAIGKLIEVGTKSGMLAELIWSFGRDRAGGSNVVEAVEFALSDWDV
jgi:hypothetical protein